MIFLDCSILDIYCLEKMVNFDYYYFNYLNLFIMLKKFIFLSLSFFLLVVCGGNKGVVEGEKDGMVEFVDD